MVEKNPNKLVSNIARGFARRRLSLQRVRRGRAFKNRGAEAAFLGCKQKKHRDEAAENCSRDCFLRAIGPLEYVMLVVVFFHPKLLKERGAAPAPQNEFSRAASRRRLTLEKGRPNGRRCQAAGANKKTSAVVLTRGCRVVRVLWGLPHKLA